MIGLRSDSVAAWGVFVLSCTHVCARVVVLAGCNLILPRETLHTQSHSRGSNLQQVKAHLAAGLPRHAHLRGREECE